MNFNVPDWIVKVGEAIEAAANAAIGPGSLGEAIGKARERAAAKGLSLVDSWRQIAAVIVADEVGGGKSIADMTNDVNCLFDGCPNDPAS